MVRLERDICAAGWRAVELFNHALDWLGPPHRLSGWLGDLQVATFFGAIELPASEHSLDQASPAGPAWRMRWATIRCGLPII